MTGSGSVFGSDLIGLREVGWPRASVVVATYNGGRTLPECLESLLALNYPACTKLLGPVVPGTRTPQGSRVPGTNFELDPVTAAFNIGALIRWLDFNDTWLAAEWGHPSDNLGGILAVADYVSRVIASRRAVVAEMLRTDEA